MFNVYLLLIYTIHAVLSNFLISYGSINTIFVSVYPWSKVYVEIFVIQILLISIVLSNKSLEINLGSKIYKYIVLFF